MLLAMSTNDVWSWVGVILAAIAAVMYLVARPDTLRIAPALMAAAVGCIAAALLTGLP